MYIFEAFLHRISISPSRESNVHTFWTKDWTKWLSIHRCTLGYSKIILNENTRINYRWNLGELRAFLGPLPETKHRKWVRVLTSSRAEIQLPITPGNGKQDRKGPYYVQVAGLWSDLLSKSKIDHSEFWLLPLEKMLSGKLLELAYERKSWMGWLTNPASTEEGWSPELCWKPEEGVCGYSHSLGIPMPILSLESTWTNEPGVLE